MLKCALSLEGKVSLNEILRLVSFVRKDEGKLLLKTFSRYRSVFEPSINQAEGVLNPFDSVLDSSGRLTIYLPEDWVDLADTGLFQDLLRFSSHYNGVNISRCKGKAEIPRERNANFFFMGYITELLSNQKIERITYNKDSEYHKGRQCARTKLLLMAINQQKIPQKFLKVPERFIGGTKKFPEPELTRAMRAFVNADLLERVERLLHNLTSYVFRTDGVTVRAKLGNNLFQPVSDFLHSFKRRVKRTSVSTRGKQIVSYEQIDPTKPSQLATVAPWEKEAIKELFEDPWLAQHNLIVEFEKTPGLDRNYHELCSRMREIVDKQWDLKQQILRRTKQRLELVPEKEETQWKKLNWLRAKLNELGTLQAVPLEYLPMFDPYNLIGRIQFKDTVDGFTSDIITAYRDNKIQITYPHVKQLLDMWVESNKTSSGNQSQG
jgi:hypothetical protein